MCVCVCVCVCQIAARKEAKKRAVEKPAVVKRITERPNSAGSPK